MQNKEYILGNVAQYSAKELAKFITDGAFTYEELIQGSNGQLSPDVRKEVKKLLQAAEEQNWDTARNSNSIKSLQNFIDLYPNSSHVLEAEEQIRNIRREADAKEEYKQVDENDKDELKSFIRKYEGTDWARQAQFILGNLTKKDESCIADDEYKVLCREIMNILAENNPESLKKNVSQKLPMFK